MKTGRNDPCPCGSGKKFKKCCALVAVDVVPTAPAATAADAETPPTETVVEPRGGRHWVPLQHQAENLRPNRFGRKKPW